MKTESYKIHIFCLDTTTELLPETQELEPWISTHSRGMDGEKGIVDSGLVRGKALALIIVR